MTAGEMALACESISEGSCRRIIMICIMLLAVKNGAAFSTLSSISQGDTHNQHF